MYTGPNEDWKTVKEYDDGCSFIFSTQVVDLSRLCIAGIPEVNFVGDWGCMVEIDMPYDEDDESIAMVDIYQKEVLDEVAWLCIAEEYGVDIRIHAYDQTNETEYILDIQDEEIVKNNAITYKDWLWECPNARINKED